MESPVESVLGPWKISMLYRTPMLKSLQQKAAYPMGKRTQRTAPALIGLQYNDPR